MAKPGKSARNKGLNFEREVALDFQKLGWLKAKRHLESQTAEAIEGRDLDHTEPFIVQTKAHKDYVSVASIKQVQKKTGHYPLLITKGNHKEPMAVMYWSDLQELLQAMKKEGIF